MMKVFLGNSPWREKGRYGVRAGSRWPHLEQEGADYMPFPFFLAYATSLLRREGFEARVVDGIAEGLSEEQFLSRVEHEMPDLVLLEVSTPTAKLDEAMAKAMRQRLGTRTKIAFCGADARLYDPSFLRDVPQVDFVLTGEYEITALELARTLRERRTPSDVLGVTYRDPGGGVVANTRRPLLDNLDYLPWPARDQLPMLKYRDVSLGLPLPSLQMWASRGCPYKCNFCAWPQLMYASSRYRVREPARVVDEMNAVIEQYGYRSVYFDDDTFNIGKRRILRLCEELRARGPAVPWGIMARGDTSDEETFEAMATAGLEAVKIGVESAVQELVDRCGKGLDLAMVKESIRICKRLGLRVHLTFTFGLPGETWETAHRTIQFALEQEPDSVQFSIVTPFPGSAYYQELERQGMLVSRDWALYDGYKRAVIRTKSMEATELEEVLGEAQAAWRKYQIRRSRRRPKFLMRKLFGRLKAQWR